MVEKVNIMSFDGKDFSGWKFQMQLLLKGHDLWKIVSGAEKKPAGPAPVAALQEGADQEAQDNHAKEVREAKAAYDLSIQKWETADNKASMYLTQALARNQISYVINSESSKEIWDKLCSIHEQKTTATVHQCHRDFFDYRMDAKDSMASHIAKVEGLARKLKDLGEGPSEKAIITQILTTLPSGYRGLMSAWDSTPEDQQTLEKLTARLLKEESIEKKMNDTRISDDRCEAFFASKHKSGKRKPSPKKKFTGTCDHCHVVGHKHADCWELHPEKKPVRNKNRSAAAHEADAGALMAHRSGEVKSDGWIADSGATDHMSSDRSIFTSFTPYPEGIIPIRVANKQIMYCRGIGTVELISRIGNKTREISLKKVLYVPELGRNLFSVKAANRQGATIKMSNDGCYVKKGKTLWATGRSEKDFFHMNFETMPGIEAHITEKEQSSAETLWHQRLGHLNVPKVRAIISKLAGKDQESPAAACKGCVLGKMHRDSFPRRGEYKTKEREVIPGARMHMDLSGKVDTKSIGGSNYYLLMKDEATTFMQIAFLKTKEAKEVLMHFKRMVLEWKKLAPDHPIRCLKTDNGTEFVNQQMREYLLDQSIRHETSIAGNPEMNGMIERANRTVVECARSMLHHAGLETPLWAEACMTAVYTLNKVPNSITNEFSPHELVTGQVPDISNIRIFGSKVFVLIQDKDRKKYDAKSEQLILVGYHPERLGYRVFDPKTNTVRTVREAVVEEQMFDANADNPLQEEQQYVPSDTVTFRMPEPSHRQEVAAVEVQQQVVDADPVIQEEPVNQQQPVSSEPNQNNASVADNIVYDVPRATRSRVDMRNRYWDGQSYSLIPEFQSQANICQITDLADRWEDHEIEQSALSVSSEPTTVTEAMESDESHNWKRAMDEEMEAHREMGTWTLVPRTEGMSVVKNKWVFKTKMNTDGTVQRYRARLVAKGFSQKYGRDFDETYSPVVRFDTVRFLLAKVAAENLIMKQIDVVGAYLNADLKEDVFMEEPEKYETGLRGSVVCKLNKALYGLKQSARVWNQKFTDVIAELGLAPAESDSCLFVNSDRTLIFVLYVDDALIVSPAQKMMDSAIGLLQRNFKVTVREASCFVGIEIERSESGIKLHQAAYARKILARYNMSNCKPSKSPVVVGVRLDDATGEPVADVPYRECIGSLMYLVVCTRPDLTYVVSELSRFLEKPRKLHWETAKHVLRYLAGTLQKGLFYENTGGMKMVAYSDSDFANEKGRHSRSGVIIILNGGPVTWLSKRQSVIATSSCEAECDAAFTATKIIVWLRRLLEDIGNDSDGPTKLFIDNKGTLGFIKAPFADHQRSKHWDIHYKYISWRVELGALVTEFVRSEDQMADFLTKPLSHIKLTEMLEQVNVK